MNDVVLYILIKLEFIKLNIMEEEYDYNDYYIKIIESMIIHSNYILTKKEAN